METRLLFCLLFAAFVVGVTAIVNGNWSVWVRIGSCRGNCGDNASGRVLMYRQCNNPYPRDGGAPCQGSRFKEASCNDVPPCPVQGEWCSWMEWSDCMGNCTDSMPFQMRTRECKCPEPTNDGAFCSNFIKGDRETKRCDLPNCEVETTTPVSEPVETTTDIDWGNVDV